MSQTPVPQPPPYASPPPQPPARPRRWRRVVVLLLVPVVALPVALVAFLGWTWASAHVDTAGRVPFTRPLAIPPLAPSVVRDGVRTFDLRLQRGRTDLGVPGTRGEATTYGVNGAFLGPTLRAHRGERVRIAVTNDLTEESTLHWHGMHLPAQADGGPHQMVAPGTTWTPGWTVSQPAATLWYHPHLHGTTARQVFKGLAGMFLLDDDVTPSSLPHEYGVDDVPAIVMDRNVTDDGQMDEGVSPVNPVGTTGEHVLVNGTYGGYLDVVTERVRLRLLNASNARTYRFALTDGTPLVQVASDGGLLERPVGRRSVVLSPGERAEVVVTVRPGQRTVLRSLPHGIAGDVLQQRWSGSDDTLDVLELRAAATLRPSPALPAVLAPGSDLRAEDVVTTREFRLSGTAVNGRSMDLSRIDETVTVDTTEAWDLHNTDGRQHSFHVHDVQFRVVSWDGREPPPELAGPKDTLLLPANGRARILLRFKDFTDPYTPYMFHCHLLRHEDQGMMGQFVVVRPGERAGTPPPVTGQGHGDHGAGADHQPTLEETRARMEDRAHY